MQCGGSGAGAVLGCWRSCKIDGRVLGVLFRDAVWGAVGVRARLTAMCSGGCCLLRSSWQGVLLEVQLFAIWDPCWCLCFCRGGGGPHFLKHTNVDFLHLGVIHCPQKENPWVSVVLAVAEQWNPDQGFPELPRDVPCMPSILLSFGLQYKPNPSPKPQAQAASIFDQGVSAATWMAPRFPPRP